MTGILMKTEKWLGIRVLGDWISNLEETSELLHSFFYEMSILLLDRMLYEDVILALLYKP